MYDIIIVGGGLAGLANAILLSRGQCKVLLIERNEYPFHKVCGEYISNESLPFLQSLGIDTEALGASRISRLTVSSPYGTTLDVPLQMGAFGLSRYRLDDALAQLARQSGCEIRENTTVQEIIFQDNRFVVKQSNGQETEATFVIGSYGKRSNLDRQLKRPFFFNRSPYLGVKYHIKTDFDKDRIALHNFSNGYCGISAIEDDQYCLCYLTTRNNLRRTKSIAQLEAAIVHRNPFLKHIFANSDFLYPRPEVINEISFEKKTPVEQHILMSGDSAGMIAPLCGNGMSMALHSAKILSTLLLQYYQQKNISREEVEKAYLQTWNHTFGQRLAVGRTIQHFFGQKTLTDWTIRAFKAFPPATRWLIGQTHGEVF
jgi:flavin-dependent dehydrogenase